MEKKFEFGDRTLFIKTVSSKVITQAQKIYTKAFKKAVEDGAILKKSLDDHMRRQGLWDDHKQEEYINLIKKSAEVEYKIKSKSVAKASQLRDLALELKKIREQISNLISVRSSMDSVTAEGQAENERFNYFVSACVYDYNTQKPVFSSFDDYLDQSSSDLAIECATQFANFMYGVDSNYEDSFIENKLLRKLGLMDNKGNLVDKQGRKVDYDGNLVDENGGRIDENGVRIDINNNPVIDDGVIDDLEFEDDLVIAEESPKKRRKKSE